MCNFTVREIGGERVQAAQDDQLEEGRGLEDNLAYLHTWRLQPGHCTSLAAV